MAFRFAVPMFGNGGGINNSSSQHGARGVVRDGMSPNLSATERTNRRPTFVDPNAETQEDSDRLSPCPTRNHNSSGIRDSIPMSDPWRGCDVPSPEQQHEERRSQLEEQHSQHHEGQYRQVDIRQRAALAKAFKSRVKALCRLHLRDCHESWVVQKQGKGMDAVLEGLDHGFKNHPHWDWGKVVSDIGRRQRRRRNEYRREAEKRGGVKPMSCTRASWQFFVAEARDHQLEPNWNARQMHALENRRRVPNRLGSGGKDSFINAYIHRYHDYPQLEFIRRANEIGSKAFFEEYDARFGSPLQGSDGSSSAGDS